VGQATVVVSGKLAQFGSRLLVPVSDAMLTQFAGNFRNAAAAVPDAAAAVAPGAAAPEAEGASERATPSVAPPVKELNALGLIWTLIKGWFAGLFGKKA
jgi:hypothetical protein